MMEKLEQCGKYEISGVQRGAMRARGLRAASVPGLKGAGARRANLIALKILPT